MLTMCLGTGRDIPAILGEAGGSKIRTQGVLRASSLYALNCAGRMWLHHTQPMASPWGPSETLTAKNQKPGLAYSSEAKACLACERSQVPSPAHKKPTAIKKRPNPLECVKHVYSLYLVPTKQNSMRLAGGVGGGGRPSLPAQGC